MSRNVRGVEFADRASDGRYPLIPLATATDTSELFALPNDFLVGLYLAIPADLQIRPGRVFISRIINTTSLVSLFVTADIGNTLVEIGRFDISRAVANSQIDRHGYGLAVFEGATNYEDLRGRVTVHSFANMELQPQGEFTFEYAATGIEPDCIRPHIRHVSSLEIVQPNGNLRLGGAVRLAAGNNTRLRVEVVDGQPTVYIDALDASDLNEQLECEFGPAPPIRRINGLTGDSQRAITLIGSRCLEIQPLVSELQLRNRCSEPCASCDEAEAVRSLVDPFRTQIPTLIGLANRLDAAITQTQLNVLASKGGQDACTGAGE